jgi:hypothetical protein
LITSFISASKASFLPGLLGLNMPQVVFLGAGMAYFASRIIYNVNKSKIMQENPYSYLLTLRDTFGR